MACDTCVFLNYVHNHSKQGGEKLEPCSQRYACNPYWDGANYVGVMLTESYCATCAKLADECQCEAGARNVRTRKKHFASRAEMQS